MPTSIPKVFGIIHIVYGGVGMLASLLGLGAFFAMRMLFENIQDEELKEIDQVMGAFDGLMMYMILDIVLKVVLGLALVAAGIGLLKKKRWAQRLSVFWSVSRMIVAVGMTLLTLGPTRAFQEQASQLGDQQQQLQAMLTGAGNILGIVMVCIYPVLSLVFLTRKSVTDSLA